MKNTSVEEEPIGSSSIQTILQWPARLAGMFSALLIFLVFALIIYAIFQRYVLNTPLKWGDEMLGYVLVALVMAGAAEALRRGDHIAIDLASAWFEGFPLLLAKLFSCAAVLVFAFVLGVSAYETDLFSYDFGSYSPGYLEAPMWIPQMAILIGAIFLGLVALGEIVGLLENKKKK